MSFLLATITHDLSYIFCGVKFHIIVAGREESGWGCRPERDRDRGGMRDRDRDMGGIFGGRHDSGRWGPCGMWDQTPMWQRDQKPIVLCF